jgi:hypothetical protein
MYLSLYSIFLHCYLDAAALDIKKPQELFPNTRANKSWLAFLSSAQGRTEPTTSDRIQGSVQRINSRARIFKLLRSPRIDSKEWLYSLAGRYDTPIPIRFLAPIDCLKIQALATQPGGIGYLESIPWAP